MKRPNPLLLVIVAAAMSCQLGDAYSPDDPPDDVGDEPTGDVPPDDPADTEPDDESGVREAATGGSCAGACGGASAEGCYCDSECQNFGDCCADVCDTCGVSCAAGDGGTPPPAAQFGNFEIRFRTLIPCQVIAGPDPGALGYPYYEGDGPGAYTYNGPYRSFQQVTITPDPASATGQSGGFTRAFGATGGFWGSQIVNAPTDAHCPIRIAAGQTATATATQTVNNTTLPAYISKFTTTNGMPGVRVRFVVHGTNPLQTGAPAIDANISVEIAQTAGGQAYARVIGEHDGFPGYIVHVNNVAIWYHDPFIEGQGPGSLFPPMEFTANSGWKTVQ